MVRPRSSTRPTRRCSSRSASSWRRSRSPGCSPVTRAARRTNLASMSYIANEARQELLDTLGEAIDAIAESLAALGAAYEQLGTAPADRLEEELFRPVQSAYGRAKRTHSGFAQRQGLPERTFAPANPGRPSTGIRGFVDSAVASVDDADATLAELQ